MHRHLILRKTCAQHVFACLLSIAFVRLSFGQTTNDNFNEYLLRARDIIEKNYSDKGYADRAYTHSIEYGSDQITPEAPPKTMCVAAMAELIAIALNEYYKDSGDAQVFSFLPARNFRSMSANDLRSYIWVDPRLKSYGTADALEVFNIGKKISFADLKSGSFINFNRLSGSGHAVLFVAFLDAKGNVLAKYDKKVAGFKYFSSQGMHLEPGHGSGFGYRYAFFGNKVCPALQGKMRDCGVRYSTDQRYLNTGYMISPKVLKTIGWNTTVRDKNLDQHIALLYADAQKNKGKFKGIQTYQDRFEFEGKVTSQDVMTLNPAYRIERTTDDTLPNSNKP